MCVRANICECMFSRARVHEHIGRECAAVCGREPGCVRVWRVSVCVSVSPVPTWAKEVAKPNRRGWGKGPLPRPIDGCDQWSRALGLEPKRECVSQIHCIWECVGVGVPNRLHSP